MVAHKAVGHANAAQNHHEKALGIREGRRELHAVDAIERALRLRLSEIIDEDVLSEILTDSLDMDWTPSDGARAIIARLGI